MAVFSDWVLEVQSWKYPLCGIYFGLDFYRSLWILFLLSNRSGFKCFFIILALQAKWCKRWHWACSFSGKIKSLSECLQGNKDGYILFFRMRFFGVVCLFLNVTKAIQRNNLLMPPCIWNGIPNHPSHQSSDCLPQSTSGRCSTQGLAFPALAEAGAVSEEQGYLLLSSPVFSKLLDPDLLSFLGQATQSSVSFSQLKGSPVILLFYLWIFLLSCQSWLGSGMSLVHCYLLVPLLRT